MSKSDPVTKPSHYQLHKPCKEVRDVIIDRNFKLLSNFKEKDQYDLKQICAIQYNYSNAIEYLMRWFEKNGTEDLEKAQYCINSMLCVLYDIGEKEDSTDKLMEHKSNTSVYTVGKFKKGQKINQEMLNEVLDMWDNK